MSVRRGRICFCFYSYFMIILNQSLQSFLFLSLSERNNFYKGKKGGRRKEERKIERFNIGHCKHSFGISNITMQIQIRCLCLSYMGIHTSLEIITNQVQSNDIGLANYKFIEMCDRKEYMLVAFPDPGFKGNFESLCPLHEGIDHQKDVLIKKVWQVRSLSSLQTSWSSKSTLIKHSQPIFLRCPIMQVPARGGERKCAMVITETVALSVSFEKETERPSSHYISVI